VPVKELGLVLSTMIQRCWRMRHQTTMAMERETRIFVTYLAPTASPKGHQPGGPGCHLSPHLNDKTRPRRAAARKTSMPLSHMRYLGLAGLKVYPRLT